METQRLRRIARTTANTHSTTDQSYIPQPRSIPMTTSSMHSTSANTSGWVTFSYAQFGAAC